MTIWSPEDGRRRAFAAATMGARRQQATAHGEEDGRHGEVQKLTRSAVERTARIGEVGDGRKQARRRRTAAEGGAKFASL